MTHADITAFLMQVSTLLCVALAFGGLARRLGQSAILGELIGGILVGATVLGALAPDLYHRLFLASATATVGREAVVKLGMLFFLFVAGTEVDLRRMRGRGIQVSLISILGILIPFSLGFGFVMLIPGLWDSPNGTSPQITALFVGTALSISALPVIARILIDLKLMRTELGITVMAAAMCNDLVGWVLFSFIVSSAGAGSSTGGNAATTGALVMIMFVLMLTAGRWAAQRLVAWIRANLPWPVGLIGISASLVLVFATLFQMLGIHASLGAFLVGVAMAPPQTETDDSDRRTIGDFVTNFFGAPLYFVSVGLTVNFAAHFDWRLVGLVLLIACFGKIAGAWLGGRLAGLAPRERLAIGFGLNARGAMGIILASMALENRIIGGRLFVALVVMSLVTSVLSGPIMQRLVQSRGPSQPVVP